ncbi:1-acyl-sn-glycerol-3-phosphate acyltransferase [Gordonia sp. CPCC 205333]|uniref:1-acyl-sn-glycerol-3-phosphate acyltransferase n=1 Tax=Gordonia sp. CPCC 205333 TaxID=3140790 RepID=UPI003AF3F6A5
MEDVTMERASEVYDYYLAHQQPLARARMMYGILAWRHKPKVTYADGAREVLRSALRGGDPILISANHIRETDPFILAATGFVSPLRSHIGRMRVLAKDELFEDPDQRRKIDALGGIPVFRSKDHGVRAAMSAGQRMIDICAQRMAQGDFMAVFPEGTCNPDDPALIQKLGSGVGHIATRATKLGASPWLLSIGISYRDIDGVGPRPLTVINTAVRMSDAGLTTPASVTRHIAADLQATVDLASGRRSVTA